MAEQVQEKRYWSHDEIGSEASGLIRAQSALETALSEIETLPSRSEQLLGEPGISDVDLEALREMMGRIDRACGHATDAAADSYADYCEEQAAAIAAEWEEWRA